MPCGRQSASSSRWRCRWRRSTGSQLERATSTRATPPRYISGGDRSRWRRRVRSSSPNSSTTHRLALIAPNGRLSARRARAVHGLIERLGVWEETGDRRWSPRPTRRSSSRRAGSRRRSSTRSPVGTIPLEAQRLGLEAHASDLNPVAVLINKALIEIPPKFSGRPPAFPGLAESRLGSWDGAIGIAADVRAYGGWMREEAQRRIGEHYPPATLTTGPRQLPSLGSGRARSRAQTRPVVSRCHSSANGGSARRRAKRHGCDQSLRRLRTPEW